MSSHPILYKNANATVTLIDIPASIAHAQGFRGRVVSNPAIAEPYASTEPKTQKARDKVLARVRQFEHEIEYAHLIRGALKEIASHHIGAWTLPRWSFDVASIPQTEPSTWEEHVTTKARTVGLISADSEDVTTLDRWDRSYYNDSDDMTTIRVSSLNEDFADQSLTSETHNYQVPSRSSFLEGHIDDKFRNFIRWLAQEHDMSRVFNLILLDPPWENRSAKRRAAYGTGHVRPLIISMDLHTYLAPQGLVAIWVTNKPAHRELILGAGGIFESLNVSLVEEWIWIKTTNNGEPVMQLDGIWRKPYEVLLIGQAPESRLQTAHPTYKVVKRVLAGVPDFHSRKPCIKTLIEPFLPKRYQALEVFARYLVEGWTSWGNEVLKYNFEGFYEV